MLKNTWVVGLRNKYPAKERSGRINRSYPANSHDQEHSNAPYR